MIVKMQKVTLLLSARHRESALERLRELGIVHIDFVESPVSEDIHVLETELQDVEKALHILGVENAVPGEAATDQAPSQMQQIFELTQQKNDLSRELEELREQYQWYRDWGAVSLASLKNLEEAGIAISFHVVDKSALKKWPSDVIIHIVKRQQKAVYLARIADSREEPPDFEEQQIPLQERAFLESEIARIEQQIEKIDRALNDLSGAGESLLAYRADLEKKLEFNRVKSSMGEEGHIAYLQGFCPIDSVPQIQETALREGWVYIIEDPNDLDEVPILIRSPKWLRIIEPVFRFMGTVPGYGEYDISFWFLLFFSLFFALLIGDAGYGLGLLLANIFLAIKFKNAPREPFLLMHVLSGTTIIWGAVSGTWFGYEKIAQLPVLNWLVIDQVNSFVEANQSFMMLLCFVIGVVHLTIARGLAMIRYINSLVALAELGWIITLWALFFIAAQLVLGKEAPAFTQIAMGVGLVLGAVFFQPSEEYS